jgi:hypothetical protein
MLKWLFDRKTRVSKKGDDLVVTVPFPSLVVAAIAAAIMWCFLSSSIADGDLPAGAGIAVILLGALLPFVLFGPTETITLTGATKQIAWRRTYLFFPRTRLLDRKEIQSYFQVPVVEHDRAGNSTGRVFYSPVLVLRSGEGRYFTEKASFEVEDARQIVSALQHFLPAAQDAGLVVQTKSPSNSMETLLQRIHARAVKKVPAKVFAFVFGYPTLLIGGGVLLPTFLEPLSTYEARVVSSVPWCEYRWYLGKKSYEIETGECSVVPEPQQAVPGTKPSVIQGENILVTFTHPEQGELAKTLFLHPKRAKQVMALPTVPIVYRPNSSHPVKLTSSWSNALGFAGIVGLTFMFIGGLALLARPFYR